MTKAQHPNCGGSWCLKATGEVRRFPHTKDPHHGADIVCRACYFVILNNKRQRNRELAPDLRYELPEWESLEVC